MGLKQNILSEQAYIGRFAPTPSGLLHFGSLLSALASYLDAKANHGTWLLRIDDIDPPRQQQDAAESILKSLETFGLHWDDKVIYQSDRFPSYINSCITFIENDLVYPCFCTRQSLSQYSQYPGHCKQHLSTYEKKRLITTLQKLTIDFSATREKPQLKPILKDYALRLVSHDIYLPLLNFKDEIQGAQKVPENFGDFIVLRKDSLPSYMLACGLDDLQDKITHIVRGSDLLESSLWQRYLQIQHMHLQGKGKNLNISYAHLPLILNDLHQKLSKQHHAPEIDPKNKNELLYSALLALGQKPDKQLQNEKPSVILEWAINHWQLAGIPKNNILFDSLIG